MRPWGSETSNTGYYIRRNFKDSSIIVCHPPLAEMNSPLKISSRTAHNPISDRSIDSHARAG